MKNEEVSDIADNTCILSYTKTKIAHFCKIILQSYHSMVQKFVKKWNNVRIEF